MSEQNEPRYKVIMIPEDNVTQMSETKFEPGKGETLVFVKIVAMNQPCIKSRNHDIPSAFADKGHLVFGEVDEVRRFLVDMLNETMDQAKKDAELNP